MYVGELVALVEGGQVVFDVDSKSKTGSTDECPMMYPSQKPKHPILKKDSTLDSSLSNVSVHLSDLEHTSFGPTGFLLTIRSRLSTRLSSVPVSRCFNPARNLLSFEELEKGISLSASQLNFRKSGGRFYDESHLQKCLLVSYRDRRALAFWSAMNWTSTSVRYCKGGIVRAQGI
jgi:hypothetical protein